MDETPQIPQEIAFRAALTQKLYEDPKTREQFLGLIKEHAPNVRIPEIDAKRTAEEAFAPHLKKMGEVEDRLLKREAQIAAREERQDLVARGVAAPDQFAEIEKFQTERHIGTFKDAAELYRDNQRAAEPRALPSEPFMLPGANQKGLFQNPTQWARQEAMKVLNESKGRR